MALPTATNELGSTTTGDVVEADHINELRRLAEETAIRVGSTNTVSGTKAFGTGTSVTASGNNSSASGSTVTASGLNSHATGENVVAAGRSAQASGKATAASGAYSHAEGNSAQATGEAAHAEGFDTKATSTFAHAEGYDSDATSVAAHAEGRGTTASGYYSHAEGLGTTASGQAAHAEGEQTIASASHAHGEGYKTEAIAEFSHAGGFKSKATFKGQFTRSGWYTGDTHAAGSRQYSYLTVHNQTTDDTPTPLFLGMADYTERLVLPSDTTWGFTISLVARRTNADNESAFYEFKGCIDNNAGTTALVGSVTKTVVAEDTGAWDADVTADDANNALIVMVTGAAGSNIDWLAHVMLVQITA